MIISRFLWVSALFFGMVSVGADAGPPEDERDWSQYPVQEGPFDRSFESLNRWECPDWFRDAKLGLWMHWGPQAVPMAGDWYARHMYIQGHHAYNHHVANFGHPSEFGYKDIIALFNPTEADFEERMKMYTDAGAKYVVFTATHHDNFDMWDSKHHEWNPVQKGGSGRNLLGEFTEAAKAAGVRYGFTHHNDKALAWMQTSRGSDAEGPLKGVPYDGADPEYQSLYGPPYRHADDQLDSRVPRDPPEWWELNWYLRVTDVVDRYEPDLFYFDGTLPFQHDDFAVGRQFLANYYNGNIKRNGGKLEAVMCLKDGRRTDMSVLDLERRGVDHIKEYPWQTDTCIGNWYYNLSAVPHYKSVDDVVTMLIDIVSKNGNLLLSVPVHPSGEPQPEELAFLEGLGEWMAINGEGIYETRPWLVYGEGDLVDTNYGIDGMHEAKVQFNEGDYRFTSREDTQVYAFFMAWPGDNVVLIKSLADVGVERTQVNAVRLLGLEEPLKFDWSREGLRVFLPDTKPGQHAWCLRIDGERLRDFKVPAAAREPYADNVIPGVVPSYHFDKGGQTEAYHDTTPTNYGGQKRYGDVDVTLRHGQAVVNHVEASEWLTYTVNGELGIYDVTAEVAGGDSGGFMELYLDEQKVGEASIPEGKTPQAVRLGEFVLPQAGTASLRILFTEGSGLRFDALQFEKIGLPPTTTLYLSDLDWEEYSGPRKPNKDRDRDGGFLVIDGVTYDKGIGHDSQVSMTYDLNGEYHRFQSVIGVDDDMDTDGNPASLKFQVFLDGKKAYDSGVMTWKTRAKKVDLDLTGVETMKLVVDDAGDGRNSDHANWADAKLIRKNSMDKK